MSIISIFSLIVKTEKPINHSSLPLPKRLIAADKLYLFIPLYKDNSKFQTIN